MGFLRVGSKVFRRPVGRGGGAGDEDAPRPAHHAALATSACVIELKLLGRTKIVLGQCYAEGGDTSLLVPKISILDKISWFYERYLNDTIPG